jgi:hypothetical protein
MANLLRYVRNPKKVGAISSLNCSLDPRREMLITRKLWGKNAGIQATHLIQSFSGYECDRATANKIGLELAKKIAPNFEVLVITHVDAKNVHNHIVINSVSYKTGKKFHQTNYKKGSSQIRSNDVNLANVREINDQLCRERGLSVPEPRARNRRNDGERRIEARGQKSWRAELKSMIDNAKSNSKSFTDFKANLAKIGVEIKVRGENITFKHPDVGRSVRGVRLGEDYTLSHIRESVRCTPERSFNKIIELNKQLRTETSPEKRAELQRQFNAEKQYLDKVREREPDRERGSERERELERELERVRARGRGGRGR